MSYVVPCLPVYLDWLCVLPYLPPRDGLVRPRAAVGAVELGGGVNEHAEVGAVAL